MSEIGIMSSRVEGMTWRDWVEAAMLADRLGYSSISEGESWGQDAFTRLAHYAAVTSRIRIGTSIVPVWGRSPANLAMASLSLDLLSRGRFFLGLGTAGKLVAEELHAQPFEQPQQRLREYLDILRLAMRGEKLTYTGKCIQIHSFQLRFRPFRESFPIYLAALGTRSLQLAGELADGWLGIHNSPERMAPILDEIATGARAAGRSLAQVSMAPQISIYVTEDVESARAQERNHLAFYIAAQGPCFRKHMRRIGFGKEAREITRAFHVDFQRATQLVSDELVDAVTIIGSPKQCRDRIEQYFAAGVDEMRLVFNEPNKDRFFAAMRAVAPGSR